ncbi:hypothetical protein H4R22_001618 [Coemansia sp. RSA 1290]|nr:hypothetical protein H4R22_001618 [Coemansia sp. RSA 1290]KAJ2653878.1 hypothetical protein IWW40_000162 [Coemansia sp. RSA 1250]
MPSYLPSTKESVLSDPSAMRIRGVVFDMDGTLTTPINEYLQQMRRDINVPEGMDTLGYVDTCLEGEAREQAHRRILEIETAAMASMELSPGLIDLLRFLQDNGIRTGVITRNNRMAVDHFINNVVGRQLQEHKGLFSFDPILDRSFRPIKPSPDGLLHISQQWGIPPQQLMMVGDHGDDLLCGIRAGSIACLLRYQDNCRFEGLSHLVVDRIDELIQHLSSGFRPSELTDGKAEKQAAV